jgi:heme exporter protein C
MKFVQKHWWKVLTVQILLYVFFFGLSTPLSPGIEANSPQSIKTGEAMEMSITGYNTHFKKAKEPIRIWLEVDTAHAICAEAIKVIDDTHLKAAFTIPNQLPYENTVIAHATLIVNSAVDGSAIQPSAATITISPSSLDSIENKTTWTSCLVEQLYSNKQFDFPYRNILSETIRNLYFHVPMWFGMMFIFLASVIFSIMFLMNKNPLHDIKAKAYAEVGVVYGLLGLLTGGIWAQYTWGAFWSFDIKQNMSAIAVLIYLAYFVLRSSFDDFDKQARLGAVYNIFAFTMLVPLLFIIPRLYASLHPGNGGNPGLGGEDLDNTMRTVFYPAVIGWTLFGFWIGQLIIRISKIQATMRDEF